MRSNTMRFHALGWLVLLLLTQCGHTTAPQPLNTGKFITPRMDTNWQVGTMPMSLALNSDGKYLLCSDMGYHDALWSIRTTDGIGVSHLDFDYSALGKTHAPASQPAGEAGEAPTQEGSKKTIGLYYGLTVARSGLIYASQGAHASIGIFSVNAAGQLTKVGSIKTGLDDFPAGLATDGRGLLYVADNGSGYADPFKMPGGLTIYDPDARLQLGHVSFTQSHGGTSNFPFGIAVPSDGSAAYLASERDDAVYAVDTKDPQNPSVLSVIPVGAHPTAVLLSHDESRLFVANSLSDTITVIDTAQNRAVDTILLRPDMVRDIPGVTPTAMALSPDGDTLYVALGDMDAIGVVDLGSMQLKGYVPAGWYPSALAVMPDGRLFVANAKGTSVRNPNNMPDKFDPKRTNAYILSIINGNVCTVRIPQGDELDKATETVMENNRLTTLSAEEQNPLADIDLSAGKITHVIYIIKENRTYDQVLGDMPQGNGDKSLVIFGKDVTPNEHAFADRFVLLDNLYACGEVSGDGWNWSTQGMADAYVERNVPYHYSGRGRHFDFEGQNNGYITGGFPAKDEDGKPLTTLPSFAKGAPPIPDVANTGRNLWDIAREMQVSIRNFGFYLSFNDRITGLAGGPDNYPTSPGLQPPGHDLDGVSDIDYRRFDLDFPDSDAPSQLAAAGNSDALYPKTVYGKYHSPCRFAEWNREFQMMLNKSPDGSAVPALMLVRMGEDHTRGAQAGSHTPSSYVADNDYGIAELVQAVSHSSIWNNTAIFIIEDDAQSGADHVDAHRTIGFVISPWIKTHSVDHHFYNTDSMLKTMELILDLNPMTQYDAVADPIMDWDITPSNSAPYDAITPSPKLIAQRNPKLEDLTQSDPRRAMELASARMDFTHADAAPALELDQIVWKTVKGPGSQMPVLHTTLSKPDDKDGDKDDDRD